MKKLGIKAKAVLIGYDAEGKCIYSELLDLSNYYDGERVWDDVKTVRKMKLRKVKGYLFDSKGALSQEFESVFDLRTGVYASGNIRFADGTLRKHRAKA
jgi:hypothetical protein